MAGRVSMVPCWVGQCRFMGPLIPFLVMSEFRNQDGFLQLVALLSTYNRFLRSTSGVTSADLLAASVAVEPFDPQTSVQVLVRHKSRIKRKFGEV